MNHPNMKYAPTGSYPRPGYPANPLMTNIMINSPQLAPQNGQKTNFSSPQPGVGFNPGQPRPHLGHSQASPYMQAGQIPHGVMQPQQFGPSNGSGRPSNLNAPTSNRGGGVGQHNPLTPPADLRQMPQNKRNPLLFTMGNGVGNSTATPEGKSLGYGNGMPSPNRSNIGQGMYDRNGNYGVQDGAPGPRSLYGAQGGQGHYEKQGGINPNSVQFKQALPQSPMPYGHQHPPVHAIGDMNDPLSKFRSEPHRVDLEGGSRGKVGYSPKPRRDDFGGSHHKQGLAQSENLVESQHTFTTNPRLKKAPPRSILKKTGQGNMKNRPKSTTFNQDVMVHEVESWKIYNVDMGKEAKRNFRRESQQECSLI